MKKILLDFDGVVNAFERLYNTSGKCNFGNPYNFTYLSNFLKGFNNKSVRVIYAREVVDWLNNNSDRIFWLTSWSDKCTEFAKLGLSVSEMSVIRPVFPENASVVAKNKIVKNGSWKKAAGYDYIFNNPDDTFVWVDDDPFINKPKYVPVSLADKFKDFCDNVAFVNPDPRFGLSPDELNFMEV